ncbi:MAG: sacsin N-terminal ATP-binding-like domain-containing protein [Actinomycetes bacterium]
MSADPLGTAALRARVLDAWAASPARFREDANAEEDLSHGAYRERLVVELAQNAADASLRAGDVPGRLLLRLTARTLVAANTGAPLDAEGVQALSTLRASAKRSGDMTGRFGVGFAAVLAVTDAPEVRSSAGSVRWSREDAHAEVRHLAEHAPELGDELDRRGGGVPVLRLPYALEAAARPRDAARPPDGSAPAEPPPDHRPDDYDTAVVLPLRDEAAVAAVRQALSEVDATLLLTLPALGEVVVEVDGVRRALRATRSLRAVVVEDGDQVTRWRTASATGPLDPALLADRPTEERAHPAWTVTCAVPVDDEGRPQALPDTLPRVVHAPTRTDDPSGLPALLVASFPLDSTRRQVAPGPLRDFLVERSAEVYARLVADLASDPALLSLVPGPVPSGALDGALREAVRIALAATPLLPAADGGRLLRARDAVALGPDARGAAAPERLAAVLPRLVEPAWWAGHGRATAMRLLGVRETPLADLVDDLASLRLDPRGWYDLYAALDGADRDALGALPVPLVDGRLVRGPRGVLTPEGAGSVEGLDLAVLAPLAMRVVHPDAAHPLLLRLGSVPATPRSLLDDPSVRAAVTASYDEDDPSAMTEAVLALVAAAGVAPGEEEWLADLALPGQDGEWYPAGELLLPDGPLASLVRRDAPFGLATSDLVARWGAHVLEAVGVLRTFAVVRAQDVPLDPDASDHDLDAEDEWLEEVREALPESAMPPVLGELVAVRDLEMVDPDRWADALRVLGAPPLREVLTRPGLALLADGRRVETPSYTAWWLARAPVVGGRRPHDLRLGDDPRLASLYADAPADADADLLRALGARTSLEALLDDPSGPDDLLSRLADPAVEVDRDQLTALHRALVQVPADRVRPPDAVRAVVQGRVAVADPAQAVVLDAPDLLPLVGDRPLLLVPAGDAAALADLLALPVASEVVSGAVGSAGREEPVPAAVREVLAGTPAVWTSHDRLVVDGVDVGWRYVDGTVHAASPEGLARGLAWAAGAWERRHLVEVVLQDPSRAVVLRAEADLDAGPPLPG